MTNTNFAPDLTSSITQKFENIPHPYEKTITLTETKGTTPFYKISETTHIPEQDISETTETIYRFKASAIANFAKRSQDIKNNEFNEGQTITENVSLSVSEAYKEWGSEKDLANLVPVLQKLENVNPYLANTGTIRDHTLILTLPGTNFRENETNLMTFKYDPNEKKVQLNQIGYDGAFIEYEFIANKSNIESMSKNYQPNDYEMFQNAVTAYRKEIQRSQIKSKFHVQTDQDDYLYKSKAEIFKTLAFQSEKSRIENDEDHPQFQILSSKNTQTPKAFANLFKITKGEDNLYHLEEKKLRINENLLPKNRSNPKKENRDPVAEKYENLFKEIGFLKRIQKGLDADPENTAFFLNKNITQEEHIRSFSYAKPEDALKQAIKIIKHEYQAQEFTYQTTNTMPEPVFEKVTPETIKKVIDNKITEEKEEAKRRSILSQQKLSFRGIDL